jgi:hypothetical protein
MRLYAAGSSTSIPCKTNGAHFSVSDLFVSPARFTPLFTFSNAHRNVGLRDRSGFLLRAYTSGSLCPRMILYGKGVMLNACGLGEHASVPQKILKNIRPKIKNNLKEEARW